MKKHISKLTHCLIVSILISHVSLAQPTTNKKDSEYKFTITKSIESTPVQSQGKTGTCWSFSTLSFFESEVMRIKHIKDVKLSEMYVVRKTYPLKADNYIRMHGKASFAEGGEPTDVINCWKNYGMVPLEAYNGKLDEAIGYNHKRMDSVLLLQVNIMVAKDKIDPVDCHRQIESTLETYMGP
ncbi:MAG TPA: C1 family peptidase, partial [Bacteroidia bacterium]|nr:C1 family peptidase [Bacteroidia bacterium]